MGVVTKRSSMTFFSDPADQYSHRVRVVLAEKGVTVDIVDVASGEAPDELPNYNPYNEVPTLVDRDLALYQADIIMEYLDERFPHPPLLPVYPVSRAQCRQLIYRIERDWGESVRVLLKGDAKASELAAHRKELRENLLAIAPIFLEKPYFMSDEFTLVDCAVGPILWRLPIMGVELPAKQAKPLLDYAERLFERPAFQESLSEAEREMRQPL